MLYYSNKLIIVLRIVICCLKIILTKLNILINNNKYFNFYYWVFKNCLVINSKQFSICELIIYE